MNRTMAGFRICAVLLPAVLFPGLQEYASSADQAAVIPFPVRKSIQYSNPYSASSENEVVGTTQMGNTSEEICFLTSSGFKGDSTGCILMLGCSITTDAFGNWVLKAYSCSNSTSVCGARCITLK